jgi:hypothetical protein
VSAWCGVAGDGSRVGGAFLGSVRGLWVVYCGQFGFHGEAAHLPRNAGAPWMKRAIVPHWHHPVLLLRLGRPAVPLQRPTGLFRRWHSGCMPFPGDCISNIKGHRPQARSKERQEGYKDRRQKQRRSNRQSQGGGALGSSRCSVTSTTRCYSALIAHSALVACSAWELGAADAGYGYGFQIP